MVRVLNSRSLEHESVPVTTRPGLPPHVTLIVCLKFHSSERKIWFVLVQFFKRFFFFKIAVTCFLCNKKTSEKLGSPFEILQCDQIWRNFAKTSKVFGNFWRHIYYLAKLSTYFSNNMLLGKASLLQMPKIENIICPFGHTDRAADDGYCYCSCFGIHWQFKNFGRRKFDEVGS